MLYVYVYIYKWELLDELAVLHGLFARSCNLELKGIKEIIESAPRYTIRSLLIES